jgi:hypothetical protein
LRPKTRRGCLKATAEKLGQEQINRRVTKNVEGGGAVNITAKESWDSERLQPKKGPGDLREKKKKPNKNTKTKFRRVPKI